MQEIIMRFIAIINNLNMFIRSLVPKFKEPCQLLSRNDADYRNTICMYEFIKHKQTTNGQPNRLVHNQSNTRNGNMIGICRSIGTYTYIHTYTCTCI